MEVDRNVPISGRHPSDRAERRTARRWGADRKGSRGRVRDLVPEATEDHHCWEGEDIDVAGGQAEMSAAQLTSAVESARRDTPSSFGPLQAIATNWPRTRLQHAGDCTLRSRVRWLHRDIVHHAARKFGLPVVHVVSQARPPARHGTIHRDGSLRRAPV